MHFKRQSHFWGFRQFQMRARQIATLCIGAAPNANAVSISPEMRDHVRSKRLRAKPFVFIAFAVSTHR
jgi:hypothetical protein